MRVAAVDIGTNSVRLLVLGDHGETLAREMQITRLGQGLDHSGVLADEAIARTTAVLTDYGELIAGHRVARVRAVATSAARDAKNSREFFELAERALGSRPELLSGDDEARLSFAGATAGVEPARGPFLVVDIGGGSTEFVLGRTHPEALISVDMGCVRMSERHLRSDPPSPAELETLRADVRALLMSVARSLTLEDARLMIGLAGTITTLASLALGLTRYDPSRTHHSTLTRAQVEALFARLASASVAERRAMLIEKKRAEVIVGGAAILLTLLEEFAIDSLLVSETDILDGLAQSIRQ